MTLLETNHLLVRRIVTLRARVRRVLFTLGLARVAAVVAATALVLVVADYFLHFAGGFRLSLLIILGLGTLAGAYWYVLRPISRRLSDRFLAGRVEQLYPDFSDELVSAVDFLETHAQRRNAFAAQLLNRTATDIADVDFSRVVDRRPVLRWLGTCAAIAAIWVLLALCVPRDMALAWARWTDPFGAHAWPKRTDVEFAWPDGQPPKIWPQGEPLTVRAVVDRGFYRGMHVWLRDKSGDKPAHSSLMTMQAASTAHKGVYEKVVASDSTLLKLYVSAGDDRRVGPWVVRLAPRPAVSQFTAMIHPPAYVHHGQTVRYNLNDEPARAVRRSAVRLIIHSSEPLGLAGALPALRFLNVRNNQPLQFPMKIKAIGPDSLEARFQARRSLQGRVLIKNKQGFANRTGGLFTLTVVQDALPTISITHPRGSLAATADSVIHVKIQANDDLGLRKLYLVARNFNAAPHTAPLVKTLLPWSKLTRNQQVGSVSGQAQYVWHLAPLHLKAGARLNFYAEVRDNYAVKKAGGKVLRHPFVKSSELNLVIRSRAQLKKALRHVLESIRAAIKALRNREQKTMSQTQAQKKLLATAPNAKIRRNLRALEDQQAREAQRAKSIEHSLDHVLRAAARNNLTKSSLMKIAAQARQTMTKVGHRVMPRATERLRNAQQAAPAQHGKSQANKQSAAKATTQAGKAVKRQKQAIALMNQVLHKLSAAGNFDAIRTAAKKLLARQRALSKQLRSAASKSIGQKFKDLPKNLQKQLQSIAKAQGNLARKTDALTKRMKRNAKTYAKKSPSTAKALSKAAAISQKAHVSSSMRQAGSSAKQNKMLSASAAQSQAQQGLKLMLKQLNSLSRKQLKRLVKQLELLVTLVQRLIREETGVQHRTTLAHAAPVQQLVPIGSVQSRVQMNTISVAQRAGRMRAGHQAAPDLRKAGRRMGAAAAGLFQGHGPDALKPEAAAQKRLHDALLILKKLLHKKKKQLNKQRLAEIRKKYLKIRSQQIAIKKTGDHIAQRRRARGMLMRADMLKLAKEADLQGALAERVQELTMQLRKYSAIIVLMNSQIVHRMNTARGLLGHAATGHGLDRQQASAIARITDIINSLKAAARQKRFHGGGGGGGGGGGPSPLVPPTAQLKLLRAMQQRVNRHTAALHQKLAHAAAAAKPKITQRIDRLAQQQKTIRHLAAGLMH